MVDTTKVIYRKKEAVYGTDAVPTAALNAALTRNFQATPVAVDRIERNLDMPQRGRSKDAPSNERQTLSYELEAAGSGAAGTAPAWMEDLEACGMAPPVVTAGVKVEQRFAAIGAALSSLTCYHWHGTQKRVGLGARGTFGFNFTAGAYGFFSVQLTAMLPAANAIVDATPDAPVLTAWKDPVEVNTANTDFTLGGHALVLRSFVGEIGAQVAARNLVGGNYIRRGNHAITGTIVGEAPTIAARNYFADLRSGAEIPVHLTHGTVAGNIVELDSTHLQIVGIELQEEDDVLMVSISYGLNVGTTNDDLIITAK